SQEVATQELLLRRDVKTDRYAQGLEGVRDIRLRCTAEAAVGNHGGYGNRLGGHVSGRIGGGDRDSVGSRGEADQKGAPVRAVEQDAAGEGTSVDRYGRSHPRLHRAGNGLGGTGADRVAEGEIQAGRDSVHTEMNRLDGLVAGRISGGYRAVAVP